ncbi:cytochrome P450 monooxygenase [Penicillium nucicola]|uniref:cytochrome P450 monooxygenase n=1 Tax=Penicillium nucicola TaxID=1850975 RepID=UPI002545B738|nr:cytochrome P450 monooxygenase [Penicillium nucicola]KAJ5751534.1 cytochrome P450 monooxygenase [Penicillium nucicola]
MHITLAHVGIAGPVYRSGPNELSFESLESLQDIYTAKPGVIGKPDIWKCLSVDTSAPNILSTVNDEEHRFKHQTISTMFSSHTMCRNEDRMKPYIDHFVDLLGAPGQDLQELCNWLSLDIISDLLYHDSFNMLKSAELRWIMAAYRIMSRWAMTCMVQPKSRCLIYLHYFVPSFRSIVKLGQWMRDKSIRHIAAAAKNDDLFAFFCKAENKKSDFKYDKKSIWTESVLLLAAGSDTTSTTMAAIFFYLYHNRKALDKLTKSLRSEFKDESEISGSKLAKCIYLQACIREAMRLVPAVSNLSPRVVHAEMTTIDGYFVRKNTHVGVSLSSYNRNRAIFERQDEFLPERWISADGERLKLDLFKSFGDGRRRCAGMNLALLELALVVARALFRYNVSLPSVCHLSGDLGGTGKGSHAFAFDAWIVASGRVGQIKSDCFVQRDQRD